MQYLQYGQKNQMLSFHFLLIGVQKHTVCITTDILCTN